MYCDKWKDFYEFCIYKKKNLNSYDIKDAQQVTVARSKIVCFSLSFLLNLTEKCYTMSFCHQDTFNDIGFK